MEANDLMHKADSSLHQIIIYRSLYILKKKVELYKSRLASIYVKHSVNIDKTPHMVSSSLLPEVVSEVIDALGIGLINLSHPNELLVNSLIRNEAKQASMKYIERQLISFTKENIGRYNRLFIQKRLTTLTRKKLAEVVVKDKEKAIDRPIAEYNKHGSVVKSTEVVKKENVDLTTQPMIRIEEGSTPQRSEEAQGELYIETLPLIIADFIHNASSMALIDSKEELSNEISMLFDKSIIAMLEEGNAPQKGLTCEGGDEVQLYELQKRIEAVALNINLYQHIFEEKKKKGESTVVIQDKLEKLIAQRLILDNQFNEQQNPFLIEDKPKARTPLKESSLPEPPQNRSVALKQIHSFYSKHYILNGLFTSLDSIKSKNSRMDLSSFLKFSKDFNVSLSKERLIALFKSHTSNRNAMSFEEFDAALQDAAVILHRTSKKTLWKTIERTKEAITLMEQQELEREEEGKLHNEFTEKNTGIKAIKKGTIDKASIAYHNTHKQMIEAVLKMKYDFECLSKKTKELIANDFLSAVGIDGSSKEFKRKIKGEHIHLPISLDDSLFRAPNSLIKSKSTAAQKELLLILENKKKDNENEIKRQELYDKTQMYQIRMDHFRLSNKNNGLSMARLKEKEWSKKMKTHFALAKEVKEEKEMIQKGLQLQSNSKSSTKITNNITTTPKKESITPYDLNEMNIVNDKYERRFNAVTKHCISSSTEARTPIEVHLPGGIERDVRAEAIDYSPLLPKQEQIVSDLKQSEKKLMALLQEPPLSKHNINSSMIESTQKPKQLFAVEAMSTRVNKSYQLLSTKNHMGASSNKLITAGESIVHHHSNHFYTPNAKPSQSQSKDISTAVQIVSFT